VAPLQLLVFACCRLAGLPGVCFDFICNCNTLRLRLQVQSLRVLKFFACSPLCLLLTCRAVADLPVVVPDCRAVLLSVWFVDPACRAVYRVAGGLSGGCRV